MNTPLIPRGTQLWYCVILTMSFVTRVATVDQNSPLWQAAMGSKHTWSTGVAEVTTRAGKFAKASDKCSTQQKGIVP